MIWLYLAAFLWFFLTLSTPWGRRLNLAAIAEAIGFLLCWLLPAFAVQRFGPLDNGTAEGEGWRLPRWLSWLDTPDNSLTGDDAHEVRHATSSRYWQMVCWLARNRAYGFKWGPLGAPVTGPVIAEGDTAINRTTREGRLVCCCGPYWQLKLVKAIPGTGRCLMLNLGWLLDAFDGLIMHELGIKYSVANAQGSPGESRELVITNYEPTLMGGLF